MVFIGKVVAYLSRRDFVDHISHTSPVDGVVVVEGDYLRGRKVFARVTVTFRYGREEDEVMGLHFSREMELVNTQVAPNNNNNKGSNTEKLTSVQERLVKHLGAENCCPFSVALPPNAPCSVILDSGDDTSAQHLGVVYELRLYVGEHKLEHPHRRSSISVAVRKIQIARPHPNDRQPHALVSRGFTLSPGKLTLGVHLHRETFFHGEALEARIDVTNCSKKTVKSMKAQVVQHVEVTMNNSHFSRVISSLESREGCPITPGTNLNKTFSLTPLASSNQKRFGIALDGQVKDQDANLASSTMVAAGKNVNDALGIIVSYSLRVKLNCGAIGGELTADLPFKLMHPDPQTSHKSPVRRSLSCNDLEFEDFAQLRRSLSILDDEK
ncbi:hypothetical protein Pcinc_024053 [Petrolisthes cinctipes]|uniref:Arrestin C-terminal-like domain-containing protein n=1 Tax=Petrolisthes cinctipes TaxID=88211 RepID=A0AAE1FB62_PETCI|nr:hypothetical protein Pcinc_024053 [Petrolisthes cinctipes]